MRRSVIHIVTGILATVTVVWLASAMTALPLDPGPQVSPVPVDVAPEADAADVEMALLRVGITPERLAAAGVNSSQASNVFETVGEYLGSATDMQTHDQNCGAARTECDRLERLVRSGQHAPEDVGACAAARAAFESMKVTRTAAHDALFEAAAAGMTNGQRQALAAIRENAHWEQPVEYLTLSLTEPERVRLRDALANERISAKNGEAPDQDDQVFLTEVRSNIEVTTAQANLQVNLAPVESAWEDAQP